ncbi:MAG: plasmid stabilization protein [Dongiaceae bacterium]
MASITIRNLEAPLKARLRLRAASHGRSMEAEAREILRSALNSDPRQATSLAAAIRARFAPLGGVELPEVLRELPVSTNDRIEIIDPWRDRPR